MEIGCYLIVHLGRQIFKYTTDYSTAEYDDFTANGIDRSKTWDLDIGLRKKSIIIILIIVWRLTPNDRRTLHANGVWLNCSFQSHNRLNLSARLLCTRSLITTPTSTFSRTRSGNADSIQYLCSLVKDTFKIAFKYTTQIQIHLLR